MLASPNFEAMWKAASKRHTLPQSCTERYVPDQTLLDIETPTDNEVEEGAEDAVETKTYKEIHDDAPAAESISPTSVSQLPALTTDHESRSSTPDSDHSSGSSNFEFNFERDAATPFKRTPIPTCTQCNG